MEIPGVETALKAFPNHANKLKTDIKSKIIMLRL